MIGCLETDEVVEIASLPADEAEDERGSAVSCLGLCTMGQVGESDSASLVAMGDKGTVESMRLGRRER